ncbi:MAG: Tn3 family transposase [Verrucomicrobiae bacterium]|nr:Tn3 family transposase [Verrucomicrobiae bacterium]
MDISPRRMGSGFALRRSSLIGVFYPRYFGCYGKAVGIYTHLSDQFSVFSTQVITCLDREALYVLDGLLDHQTDLAITEHTADTHGYTEQMFGLCFLLGFSFMPRIKAAEDQYLYRMEASQRFGALDPFFVETVNTALILEQWDALVRLAASLRQRRVPAHIVLQRLCHDSCRLGRALTGLGRIVKTIFLLRYMADAELRRHILLQLNRGENRHFLARCLFFAQQGELTVGDLPGLINKPVA